jgi:hypothetical protein
MFIADFTKFVNQSISQHKYIVTFIFGHLEENMHIQNSSCY